MRFFHRFGKCCFSTLCFFSIILLMIKMPPAGSAEEFWAEMVSPAPDQEIIDRRPSVKIKLLLPLPEGSILLLVDNTDVTSLARITADTIEYRPVFVLSPGLHQVTLMQSVHSTEPLEPLTWSFSTRHSKRLEEASLGIEPSGVYQKEIENQFADSPDWRFDSNIRVDSRVKEGAGFFSLESDIRYLDQKTDPRSPVKDGFELAHLLAQGGFNPGAFYSTLSLGDVSVSGTPLSLDLARRGGTLQLGHGSTAVDVFHVETNQNYGFTDAYGLEATQENHLQGVSVGQGLFDDRLKVLGLYFTGNETKTDSLGVGTAEPSREGNMWAFMAQGDFFEGRATAFGEAAFSYFDEDLSDTLGKEHDSAYRALLQGALNQFSYALQYEYVGAQFQSLGNPGLPKDRKGFSGNMGHTLKEINLQLNGSRYEDNVERDSLFPVTVFWDAGVALSYQRWPRFPIQVGYSHNAQKSRSEPEGFGKLDIVLDSVNSLFGYAGDRFNVSFGPGVSWSKDRTETSPDTKTVFYPLSLSWRPLDVFMVSSIVSLNQVFDEFQDQRADTYTAAATLYWAIVPELLDFDLGGTYTVTRSTDDSVDVRTAGVNSRLMWSVKKYTQPYGDMRFGLQGQYNWIHDRIYSESREDLYAIFAVVEFRAPMRF